MQHEELKALAKVRFAHALEALSDAKILLEKESYKGAAIVLIMLLFMV